MYRKLKNQAERHGITVNTMRGLLKLGLRYSQTEHGTIFISDQALQEFFEEREKTTRRASSSAESLAAAVL